MYYHEIETVLRLHEFGIHDRLLKCQITKIVITRIQWDFPCKTKVAKGDPYINYDCNEIFGATICHQKATLQAIPQYLSEFRVFCATLIDIYINFGQSTPVISNSLYEIAACIEVNIFP